MDNGCLDVEVVASRENTPASSAEVGSGGYDVKGKNKVKEEVERDGTRK